MKKTWIALIAAALMTPTFAIGFDPPRGGGPRGSQQGPRDGSGAKIGGHGKKTGPRDGSGPIHQPGTGGGNGGGRRGGR
ncbi:MAG: hypothetical protein ACKV22_10540 [Bryobacteraceae bacterium]